MSNITKSIDKKDEVELSSFLQSESSLDNNNNNNNITTASGGSGFLPGPPWVINILANELCERFSYYGLRAILPLYFVSLGWSESASISVFMFSSAGAYFCSVFGGFIADSILGKYTTIMRFSLVYCFGMMLVAISALFTSSIGCIIGLFFVSIGTGGIKPNVASFGADQFPPSANTSAEDLTRFFMIFYFSINVGSVASFIITPLARKYCGYFVAFLIPSLLLTFAVYLFWKARHFYTRKPVQGSPLSRVYKVFQTARRPELSQNRKQMVDMGKHWLEAALNENNDCDAVAISETVALFRICKIFMCLPAYWMLYDQAGAAWIIQAKHLNRYNIFEPEQVGVLNPVLVLIFIPLFDKCIFPFIENKLQYKLTSVKKMVGGMILCIMAFIMSCIIQSMIENAEAAGDDNKISIIMQLPQIIILTLSEILVSTTGLDFAYQNSPSSMKSIIMALFLLTTAVGDFFGGIFYLVLGNVLSGTFMYIVFSILMIINTIIFISTSKRFVPYQKLKEEYGSGSEPLL